MRMKNYDWQSSSLYSQKMSETTILIVPLPSSQFCPHIRRYIHSCKSHLHEEAEAFDDALLKFIHALRRCLHQTRQCKCMRMNRDPSLCIIRNYACFY